MASRRETVLSLSVEMRISVKVKFGSGKREVEMIGESEYVVRVKERPVKGKANEEMIKLLSDHFKVGRINIKIVSGATSSKKVVRIDHQ